MISNDSYVSVLESIPTFTIYIYMNPLMHGMLLQSEFCLWTQCFATSQIPKNRKRIAGIAQVQHERDYRCLYVYRCFYIRRRLSIDLSTLDICFWTRGRGYMPLHFSEPLPFPRSCRGSMCLERLLAWKFGPSSKASGCQNTKLHQEKALGFYRWSEFIVRKTIWLQHDMDIMTWFVLIFTHLIYVFCSAHIYSDSLCHHSYFRS